MGWRSAPDIETIIAAANRYAASQLDLHAHYAASDRTTRFTADRQINCGPSCKKCKPRPSACLLCLGWGGGFLSKVSFHDTESDAYRKILRAIPSIGRAIRDKVLFPKTRRLIFMNGKPASIPGWAVLTSKLVVFIQILKIKVLTLCFSQCMKQPI